MNDDLKKRLRDIGDHAAFEPHMQMHHKAADRIEALEAQLAKVTRERDEAKAMQECACDYDNPTDVCLGHYQLFERLYASREAQYKDKLAKAVEAIRLYDEFWSRGGIYNANCFTNKIDYTIHAAEVLAEIEKGIK